jgi:Tol biopolymer transport system component
MTMQLVKQLAVIAALLGWLSSSSSAQTAQLITHFDSSFDSPSGGGGDSFVPVLSEDGRYVLFCGTANNLVAIGTNQPMPTGFPAPIHVFLRDRVSGLTTLVSLNASGTGGGDGDSLPSGVSTNGRYALFESSATDLIAGDNNGASDVFVRDFVAKTTLLVSQNAAGAVGNGASLGAAMTPDGRHVVFVSAASDLVAGDTNGIPDVFVRDLQTGSTTLVSVGARSTATPVPSTKDIAPGITPDGRYVVFHSVATNLVQGVNTPEDIYVRDRLAGTTVQASAGARAALRQAYGMSELTANKLTTTFNYLISTNGQYVIYEAAPLDGWGGIVFRYEVPTGLTTIINTNAAAAAQEIPTLDMTPDGRYIAFVGNITNDAISETSSILLWDGETGQTSLISENLANTPPFHVACTWPTMDHSGRFVAFLSNGDGLVTNHLNGEWNLFLRDRQTQTTTLINADTNGLGVALTSQPVPSLSADGRYVAFEAPDGTLVAGDRNNAFDVFVRELTSGATELTSAHDSRFPSVTPGGPSHLASSSISADGRWLAFASDADDLVLNDGNARRDIFLRDLTTGTTTLVSVNTNGLPAEAPSSEPSLSADGRYVAFTSGADDLTAGDSNRQLDVFVRDLQSGVTKLVSVSTNGASSTRGPSSSPKISTDGRYVLFRSTATDLAPGQASAVENLMLRDLQASKTFALTFRGVTSAAMTPDGSYVAFTGSRTTSTTPWLHVWDSTAGAVVYTNTATGYSSASPLGISPNGQLVVGSFGFAVFLLDWPASTNRVISSSRIPGSSAPRFTSDGRYLVYAGADRFNIQSQVYVYDLPNDATELVSRSWSTGATANGGSDKPDISPDGRFVAYCSTASDLVPGDENGVPDIFLYDRASGTTLLASASRWGSSSADNRSLVPVISADGRTLFFESWASDLAAGDFNLNSDLFALTLDASGQPPSFRVQAVPDLEGCHLEWLAAPGRSYQVEYKDNLADNQWHKATGTVAIVGNTAWFKDSAAPTQRFYRVVAE